MMRLELASDAVYKPIIDLIVKEYMVWQNWCPHSSTHHKIIFFIYSWMILQFKLQFWAFPVPEMKSYEILIVSIDILYYESKKYFQFKLKGSFIQII